MARGRGGGRGGGGEGEEEVGVIVLSRLGGGSDRAAHRVYCYCKYCLSSESYFVRISIVAFRLFRSVNDCIKSVDINMVKSYLYLIIKWLIKFVLNIVACLSFACV